MKIYRFVPDVVGFAHPRRSVSARWWPEGIEMGSWMEYSFGAHASQGGSRFSGRYHASEGLPLSDFPWLSPQLPIMSERAAEQLGCHPDHPSDWKDLAERLRPVWISEQPFFAVQPLFGVRGESNAFIPEASVGIHLSGGEVARYHTLMFEPGRLRGELFTIPAHEPFSETYVTGSFVERVRDAGLTGLDTLELVFDDGPVAPGYGRPSAAALDNPTHRAKEEWDLFRDRGYMWSYLEPELREAFNRAVLDGLLPA